MQDTAQVGTWVDDEVAGRWAAFPISAAPRPIVLLDLRARIEGGFVDGDSKMAWLEGAIDTGLPLSPDVLAVLPPRRQGRARTTLTISDATAVTAPFRCDRGPQALPAYRLQVTGLNGSCVVLSPEVDCWWPATRADESRGWGGAATIDDHDDLIVRFPAFGGVLTEFHRAEFQEHEAFVVGRAITSERKVPSGTAVVMIGITQHVTGRLEQPLDGRVLLNRDGQPMVVTRGARD
jgi:hypothetical protein